MTPENATNVASYQWYADGVAIAGATDPYYVVLSTDIGKKIKVAVKDTAGTEFTSAESEAVAEDLSGTFELKDDQGLQSDGTALPSDTLRVSYGSALGTPNNIAWYWNGAVMAISSLENNNLTQQSFDSDQCRVNGKLKAGEWQVIIENTAGEIWTSNVIVVAVANQAVMTDVSIEDDYETKMAAGAGVELADKTDRAILNVTFNKNYTGILYLVNSKYTKGYDDTASEKGKNLFDFNDLTTAPTYGGKIADHLVEVSTPSTLTNKKAAASVSAATGTKPAILGAYYEDSEGKLHCKIVVDLVASGGGAGEAVTRGDSYYLVWDQADIDGDELTATGAKKEDLNTSSDMVVPYVKAPASIKVTSFVTNTKVAKVGLYDEAGDALTWWNQVDANGITGFESIKLFGVNSNSKSSTDTGYNVVTGNADDSVTSGVATLTYATANITNSYVYAKMVTGKGIFAEKSVTLESEISESARPALSKMSMKESAENPNDAIVEFTGLSTKAPGTVYIFKEEAATDTMDEFEAQKVGDEVGKATVEGGATSVTVSGVFKYSDMAADNTALATCATDGFVARFVPDDAELWQEYNNGAYAADGETRGIFVLKPVITSVDKSGMTAVLEDAAASGMGTEGTAVITVDGIKALNQFGNDWKNVDSAAAITSYAASVTKKNEDATTEEDYDIGYDTTHTTSGSVSVAANGIISFTATLKTPGTAGSEVLDKGDGATWKIAKLNDMTVAITMKDKITPTADFVKIGDTASAANYVGNGATLTAAATGDDAHTAKLSSAFSVE